MGCAQWAVHCLRQRLLKHLDPQSTAIGKPRGACRLLLLNLFLLLKFGNWEKRAGRKNPESVSRVFSRDCESTELGGEAEPMVVRKRLPVPAMRPTLLGRAEAQD